MRLLIADSDRDYVSMLARSIRESEWNRKVTIGTVTELTEPIPITIFDSYDAILAGTQLFKQLEHITDKPLTLCLIEKLDEADNQGDRSAPQIYKYQPVHHLLAEVIEAYGACMGGNKRKCAEADYCKVIAVYSASGGAGKTTFATGLSELLVTSGYRTFYLNMECIPSYSGMMQRGDRKFAQLLYHLRRGETAQIRGLAMRDMERGFSTYPTAEHYNEWGEFSGDEIGQLIQLLREMDAFDCVVIDLESALSEQTISVFKFSDALMWIRCDEEFANYKTEFVRRELSLLVPDHADRLNKPVWVQQADIRNIPTATYLPYLTLLELEGKSL